MKSKLLIAAATLVALTCVGSLASAGASTPAVYVACSPVKSTAANPAYTALSHPARCDMFGNPPDSADEIQLADGKWSHWGAATTTVKGRLLAENPGMGGPPSYPATLTFSRIRKGCGGRLYYTKATIGKASELISDGCKLNPEPADR